MPANYQPPTTNSIALHYHDSTKHHFNRFARSLGYLDWATQPDPFRRYTGAPLTSLSQEPLAAHVPYSALFDRSGAAAPFSEGSIAEFLRCSMGLSAWKQYQQTRWALRVNPSSGNLHPTEAYILHDSRVLHYAPREHGVEERCRLDPDAWGSWPRGFAGFLVALSSIHWREAWKYGERAFRYCQHDTGHAIAAMRLAAAMLGWTMTILPRWSDGQIAAVLGLDRDGDYHGAEREEAEYIAVVTDTDPSRWLDMDPEPLVAAARRGVWSGTANALSRDHVDWPIIEEVARATRYPGKGIGIGDPGSGIRNREREPLRGQRATANIGSPIPDPGSPAWARTVILQRRSAVAFDARSALARDVFLGMLDRLGPAGAPWDAIDWQPQLHLLLFVHRVDGLTPGVYAYLRDAVTVDEWRAAMRKEFLWETVSDRLFLLVPTDVTWAANRISCDQEIASDGFFSLGMIARLAPSLQDRGEWFYRRLFWESGMIGQVLYLEAEAAGARSTGIGCFYDDAVHELAGLSGATWQSLYHFSMGMPVEDTRLTSEPGYAWERRNLIPELT